MLMMFPFEAPTIFEGVHKSHFRMPRVVRDQKGKFENDELFRQLSNESLVKYTAFKERPLEERQVKFITGCQEGHTEISFTQSGNQFILTFNPTLNPAISGEGCDFDKELDKVHIKAPFILNGVCVVWRGYIDLRRLDGSGCLEFDDCRAYMEEHASKMSIENNNQISSNTNNTNSKLQMQLQQQQQQPFNMLCNNNVNQNNVAAAAALAAAAAANFHPDSPLARYVSSQPNAHTPPHSQHNTNLNTNSNNNPLMQQQAPVSQHQHHQHPLMGQQQQSHQQLSANGPSLNGNGLPGAPPQPAVAPQAPGSGPPIGSPQHLQNTHPHQQQHPQLHQLPLQPSGPPLSQINACLGPAAPPANQMTQAHLAAAMGAIQNGQGPPMSIADSYGNAAMAAAAAAAFHQALSASQHHQQQAVAAMQQHPGAMAGAMSMALGQNGPGADFLAEMSHRQRAS